MEILYSYMHTFSIYACSSYFHDNTLLNYWLLCKKPKYMAMFLGDFIR